MPEYVPLTAAELQEMRKRCKNAVALGEDAEVLLGTFRGDCRRLIAEVERLQRILQRIEDEEAAAAIDAELSAAEA